MPYRTAATPAASTAGVAPDEFLRRLRSTRHDYDEEFVWTRFLMDAFAGSGGFKGRVKPPDVGFWGWAAEAYGTGVAKTLLGTFDDSTSYLDRYKREDEPKFQARVNASTYTNYVGPITKLLVSYVLKRPLMRENAPDALEEWMEDVDGRGTSWDEFLAQKVVPRTAVCGWIPVLFDAPRVTTEGLEAPLTMAQAKDLGIRPRAIQLYPANVLDWQEDAGGNFEWVKLRLCYRRKPDPLGPEHTLERYQMWFADRVVWYDVRIVEGQDPQVGPREETRHGFGRVPIAVFRGEASPDDNIRGISLLAEGAPQNRAHFNRGSELDEMLRAATFPILQVPVRNQVAVSSIVGGAENALPIPHDSTQPYMWIEPDGHSVEAYERRLEATVKEIYRTMRVEFTRPTGQATSGVSRRHEFEQTNRRLGDFAANVARGEAESFVIVAPLLSIGPDAIAEYSVTPPTDFAIEDLAEDIKTLKEAIGIGLPPRAESLLKKRATEKLLPNISTDDRAQIDDELEEAEKDAANARAMEREVDEAARTGQGGDDEELDA